MDRTKYIGEIGLDFSNKYQNMKSSQIENFNFICEQASKYNKLMTVHCNKAEQELYNIIKRNNNRKVILHWYSGNLLWIEKFLELGCYFSINANMANSKKGMQLIKSMPLDKLLIESDGPFSKINGKKFTYDKLYQVYDNLENLLEEKNLKEIIYNNFKNIISK